MTDKSEKSIEIRVVYPMPDSQYLMLGDDRLDGVLAAIHDLIPTAKTSVGVGETPADEESGGAESPEMPRQVADYLDQVDSGWDQMGEQWFVEYYRSHLDNNLCRFVVINVDRDFWETEFSEDPTSDLTSTDQILSGALQVLEELGFKPAQFDPFWFTVPISLWRGLISGTVPYNTTIVTREGQVVVFDVVDPEGPTPLELCQQASHKSGLVDLPPDTEE